MHERPGTTHEPRRCPRIAGPGLARLRDRLCTYGGGGLGDAELVALLLGGAAALDGARAVAERYPTLEDLGRAPPDELASLPGVGPAGATRLRAAFELARRAAAEDAPRGRPVSTPADARAVLAPHLLGHDREHFVVCGLDARHRVRLVHTVAVGTLAYVDVHPREVFRPLVRAGAFAAIVGHNHPSGDPTPSEDDLRLTRRLEEAGRLVGIALLDHLVFGGGAAVSLRERGLLAAA